MVLVVATAERGGRSDVNFPAQFVGDSIDAANIVYEKFRDGFHDRGFTTIEMRMQITAIIGPCLSFQWIDSARRNSSAKRNCTAPTSTSFSKPRGTSSSPARSTSTASTFTRSASTCKHAPR